MNLNLLLFIIFVTIYHFSLHNKLEKLFTQTHIDYELVKRPSYKCSNNIYKYDLNCIGMPSGHAEASALLCFLLYFLQLMPLWTSLFIITIVSLQRVIYKRHTIIQVLVGSMLGFVYASIYKYYNYSIVGISFIITFSFILWLSSKSTSAYETIHLTLHP